MQYFTTNQRYWYRFCSFILLKVRMRSFDTSPWTLISSFLLSFFFLWRCLKCFLFCDFNWNGFSLQMRCFQLSLLCIFWRKQARLVSLSGDAAERIEWLFSVENIIRILRVRRPFFPTECQPFPSCYRCSNKRQRCLKSHLGLNWIRAEPVKPRRCLEAELCFAVTLTGSWAKEQKGHPSKPLGWRLKSKPLPRQQASSRDWMLKITCIRFFVFFVCVSLWSSACVHLDVFLVVWSATVSVEMPPYIMVLKWPNQTGSNYNLPSWNSCFSEPPRNGKQELWDV